MMCSQSQSGKHEDEKKNQNKINVNKILHEHEGGTVYLTRALS